MSNVVPMLAIVPIPAGGSPRWVCRPDVRPEPPTRAGALDAAVTRFLRFASRLGLSSAEQRALLDLSPRLMEQVRASPRSALQLGGAKLERRVNYALPILQRMLFAVST